MTGFLDDLQPIGDPLQFWRSDNVWAVPAGSSGAGGKSAVVVHITSTDYIEPKFLAWEVFGSQTNWPLVDVVANAEWNKIAFDNAPIHASVEAGDTWYYWARALFDNGEVVGDLGAFGSILIVGNVDNATALSVWGRSSNTSGPRADIIAASDFQVLRRSGTAVGFGSINLASANAVTGLLALANGGLNASLAASNGGIFYSTAAAGAILAGVAAARRALFSGLSSAPSWSAYAFPAAVGTAGNVLRSDGTDFLSATLGIADLTDIAALRILGRVTGGSGDVEALTGTQATTLIDLFSSTLKGLAPLSGGGSANFLRADGTWNVPPGTGGAGTVTSITAAAGITLTPNPIVATGTVGVATAGVTSAMLRDSVGLSVVGRGANTTGVPADIVGTAGQVLRVSGTVLGFGAVDLATAASITGLLPMANGGSNALLVASTGGLVYSTATALAILAGVAAANRLPLSGNAAAPAWSPYSVLATLAQGDIWYGSSTTAMAALAKDANATRYLSNTGSSNNPAWAQVALATGVSGQLPLTNGGLNASLVASNGGIFYSTATAGAILAGVAAANRPLLSGNAAAPSWAPYSVPATVAQGDLLYATGTTAVAALAKNASATRYLSNTGATNNPAWAQVELTNGVTGVLPTANGGSLSGTYTPTLTNVANTSARTAYLCHYMRVGNVVTVSGRVDIDAIGSAPTVTAIGISLPIASALTAASQLAGTAVSPNVAGMCAAIYADFTNDRAELYFVHADVANRDWYFTFAYQVI